MKPPYRFAPDRVGLFLFLLCAGWVLAGGWPPVAQAGPTDPLRQQLQEHYRQETAAKARRLAAIRAVDPVRTPEQELYDVHHYELDLSLDPDLQILTGLVSVRAIVTGGALDRLDLNLDNRMTVSAVTAGGLPTTFTHTDHLLAIDLDQTYETGAEVVVSVAYSGDPQGNSFEWTNYNGQDMIWTLSEPYGAREWWPCKDLNTDKADSVDIRVTVPDHLYVGTNGLLISDVDNGETRTFHWHGGYPIATYLVSLAVYPYLQYSDWYEPIGGGDPMEVQFYVFPDHYDDLFENYALTVPMLEVFAAGFGEYPFVDEKYGHAEVPWGGGMEHQTLTTLGGSSEILIAHELVHQWWGDLITCADFQHIWLNEGFATWGAGYWVEQSEGFAAYQDYMAAHVYFGDGTIFVEDPTDVGAIFNHSLSYNKGSWVVHMLRGVLGEEDFFAGLQLYGQVYGYGSATTEQFQEVMENVSGRDLSAFFAQWIYGEFSPTYRFGWRPRAGLVELTIEQVQDQAGLFVMPIQVRIITSTGTEDFTLQNDAQQQTYYLPVNGEPESVLLDPDGWILCRQQTTVTGPTFDRGILLVNSVHWESLGEEIVTAYEDSAFSGSFPVTFWDVFDEPTGGYPASLPEPIGHGLVPGETLGRHSTVIWAGDYLYGDVFAFRDSPILPYLQAGGNVLLLTRRGAIFCDEELTDYLGVTWSEYGVPLAECSAAEPGLVDMPFLQGQNWNDVFWPEVDSGSTVLFLDTLGFDGPRGVGVVAQPPAGGTFRPDGGRLGLIGGRPFWYDHAALRGNIEFILAAIFGEPFDASTGVPGLDMPGGFVLGPNRPNPFNPRTEISFSVVGGGPGELTVYDMAGRLVRTLLRGEVGAGSHTVPWLGVDDHGREVGSGVYIFRLEVRGRAEARRMLLVR